MILNLKSYGAESDLNLHVTPRSTIASITEEVTGRFNVLMEKRRAVREIEEKFPLLKKETMQLQESLVGEFELLRIQTVFQYQEATGLLRNRKNGSILVDESFHHKFVEFYTKGLDMIRTKGLKTLIPLVEKRLTHYESLYDIYAEDKENFFVCHNKKGKKEIHLKNHRLVFLTTFVEEHKDVLEAINFLQQFPCRFTSDPEKYPISKYAYESYALKNSLFLMQEELDMREFLQASEP